LEHPTLVCEVCGARVATLRRGRCWICYVRWAETRPVGNGAACLVCGDRRRDNLRLVEFQGSWIPMCHNCGTRAMRLTPMPGSVEGIRERLSRDRRQTDRRAESADDRIIKKERRVGERRLPPDVSGTEWPDAADLIVEIIELRDGDEPPAEATRIMTREMAEAVQAPALVAES
jgi:hypothetical protein